MKKTNRGILTGPTMNDTAVYGHGDPNQEDGEYKQKKMIKTLETIIQF